MKWLNCYLTAGEVQCSQRLLDAIGAGNTICQTLQTPGVPWHPLKFWQFAQRGIAGTMCDGLTGVHGIPDGSDALTA